ncbi:PadR family transcriptional regulator [Peribacillus sp. TH27]|nr:PadR family transcriptional regulator [Peribacillus sp. TH27]
MFLEVSLKPQDYIEVHTEQEGNRPPRKVYSINEKGKQYFTNYSFLTSHQLNLPLERTIPVRKSRLSENMNFINMFDQASIHGTCLGVDLAIEHKIAMC